jgi:Transmembrane domain of unknown function (DUF3566)
VTTSGGTGRPTTASDGRVEVDRTEDATSAATPQGNGARSTSKASTAYEVAAALRAQASRAAQVTRDAATRVQSAVTSPEQDVQAKSGRSDAATRDGSRGSGDNESAATGAAAAVAATAPQRERPVPSTSTPQAAAPAPPPPVRAPDPPVTRSHAAPTAPARPGEQRQGGTAPPERTRVSDEPVAGTAPPVTSQPAAPAPLASPPVPIAPPSQPDDTQVSLDARPETPQPASAPSRPMPRTSAPARRTTRVRKARLRLMRIDPWSVMKTAFLLSVALGITLFVAVAVLWSVLDAAGVFTAVGDLVRDLTQSDTSGGVDIESYTALSRVLGFTTLIAVVDVVLVTALATLGAFLYNLSASLLGGLEVTLAEDD